MLGGPAARIETLRIKKLASELQCGEEQLFALLRRLGHVRYTLAEQQLPEAIETQVRRRRSELTKVLVFVPPPDAGPVRNLDRPIRTAEDDATLALHLIGVTPIRPPAPPKRVNRPVLSARPTPLTPATTAPTPVAPPPVAPPLVAPPLVAPPLVAPTPVASPLPAPTPSHLDLGGFEQQYRRERSEDRERRLNIAEQSVLALTTALEAAEREASSARRQVGELGATVGQMATGMSSLLAENSGLRERCAALERQVESGGRSELMGSVPTPALATLRRVLELRGLRGDDEMAGLLAAFLEARRMRELLDAIVVADPGGLAAFLDERVLLVGPLEEPPGGVVAARVSPDRSEAAAAPSVRAALTRLATALLVHGLRRLAIIGGPPAFHRVLRHGMDARIELQLFPGTTRPSTLDLLAGTPVVLWCEAASDVRLNARFPAAIRSPERDIAKLVMVLVESLVGDRQLGDGRA